MTGNAADATVFRAVAAAAFQAISLETNILNTMKVLHLFVRCSSMAGAAEGSDPAGREMTRVEDPGLLAVSTLHCLDVVPPGTMAALASHPGDHLV